tara:strand:+ start:488 stop:1036 length:549 start_codon:yes stop_codon:yes gene_type:complete
MTFNIEHFKGAMKLGGARNALFSVTITNPVNTLADIQVPFMIKTSQIPASTLGVIPIQYFGREVKVPGNRTYAEWTVTVLNDEDFAVRNALEHWSHSINSPSSNLRGLGSASPSLYKSSAQVTQFSKTGAPLRIYNFVGIWPSEVSTIDLDWSTEGIEEYTVNFTYDYWTVSGGITGNAGSS